jgi:rubredoxin
MNPLPSKDAIPGAPTPQSSARQERVPLLRLAVSCPRCGARPAVRVTPALVEVLSGEPAELRLGSYQCHRQKCGHVYDITAGAYQRAS